MITLKQLPSYADYLTSEKVWMPQEGGDQSLFLVRVPLDMKQMDFQLYRNLMTLRLEWMLQESGETQEQLQTQLTDALFQLNPAQSPPSLYEETEEGEEMLQLWAMAYQWGVSLLEANETWLNRFRLVNPEVEFPVDLTQVQADARRMEVHDSITIEDFLTELTAHYE